MAVMPTPYQPLSVRTGQRNPLPYHEGVPAHLRSELASIVDQCINESPEGDLDELMVLQLQIPARSAGEYPMSRIQRYCAASEQNFLDALDYVLASQWVGSQDKSDAPEIVVGADLALTLGSSVWNVAIEPAWEPGEHACPAGAQRSPYRAGLRRRVPQTTEDAYLSALGIGGAAEGHLVTAWHAAYSPHPDKDTVWQSSVKAVEAALQPIVEPQNQKAQLGSMRAKIRDAPQNWDCQLPLWDKVDAADPAAAFVQCLSRVTYQGGRHGADPAQITLEQARAVMIQAVAICEWIRAGVFRRAQQETAGL